MEDASPLVKEAEKRAQWWEERWARRPEGKEKDEAAERMDAWQTVAAELREESTSPGSPVAGGYAAWRSVEDELPQYGEEVLVYRPDLEPHVTALARYSGINRGPEIPYYWDNRYGGSNTNLHEAVTHWAPLPDGPDAA